MAWSGSGRRPSDAPPAVAGLDRVLLPLGRHLSYRSKARAPPSSARKRQEAVSGRGLTATDGGRIPEPGSLGVEHLGFAMTEEHLAILIHLGTALLAGALIGLERTFHGRPAGSRTHASVASTLLMR